MTTQRKTTGKRGEVWQGEDGKWSYRVTIHTPHGGTSRPQRNGFASERDAKAAVVALKGLALEGKVITASKITLAEYLEAWLESIKLSVKPNTLDQYQTAMRSWVIPHIGQAKLTAVTPEMLEGLYATLSVRGKRNGTGLGARSVRVTHRILHRAFGKAVARKLIATNPAAREFEIDKPRVSKLPAPAWGTEDARKFLAANKDHRLYALLALMIYCGVRRGEALGLRWINVDLTNRRITIREALVVTRGKVDADAEVKTTAGVRVLQLDDELVRILDKHQANEGGRSEYVFTTLAGGLIHPQNLRRLVDTACKRAGLKPLTPKGFRHTAATVMLESGAPMKVVQEMLGHSDFGVTADTYTHVSVRASRAAADTMGAALFGDDES